MNVLYLSKDLVHLSARMICGVFVSLSVDVQGIVRNTLMVGGGIEGVLLGIMVSDDRGLWDLWFVWFFFSQGANNTLCFGLYLVWQPRSCLRTCNSIGIQMFAGQESPKNSRSFVLWFGCTSGSEDLVFLPMLYNSIANDSQYIEAGLGVGCSKMLCSGLCSS